MAQISNITLPSGTNYGIRATGILHGDVDSSSTATDFTATIPGVTEYYDGLTIMLRNGEITSASGFTLNINGLGAKPVYSSMGTGNDRADPPTGPTRDTTIFNVTYTMLFVYVSTLGVTGITDCWVCYRGYNANDNTIGYLLRNNNGPLPVTDTARYYKLYFTSADNEGWVPASVNSTNNATAKRDVNQRPINPFGKIVYTSATTSYTTGTNLAASTAWFQYQLVLGYSFNRTGAALTLTSKKPVYVKCAPQSDGSAIMDADVPIVQDLPSTEDGKIYIYLGIAYDATHIELIHEHPVYYYKNGAIRLWTNAEVSNPPVTSVNNKTGAVVLSASDVGAVANTAVGAANGVAPLNASSKIDETYLPSYVDDVIEGYYYNNKFWKEGSHTTEIPGESGKIYVDLTTNKTYRWSGSTFVEISPSPVIPSATESATTGISITNHSSTSIYGVSATDTSVTGVQSTTTTASHVKSGGNGTAPTLGTAFSIPNVTGASDVTVPIKNTSATTVPIKNTSATSIPNVTAAGSGSFTQGSFNGGSFTQGTDSFTPNTPTAINTSKFSGGSYSHSGFSGGSFTRGTFNGGSLTMAVDSTDTKQLNITFTAATHANDSFTAATYGTDSFTPASLASGFYTAGTSASFTQGEDSFTPATHGADSHTHTPPTLGTAISIIGVQSSTTSVTGVQSSTTTASKVTLGTAFSVPNVTSAGSASSWVFEDVTVPIKNTSATTVPVRNTSATMVATSVGHIVIDDGHTHDI